ncbi:hypothetical protein M5M_13471 [Simiduia agarivorans SA1 = DSM 21679]|uniref:Lipoprotein n=1 Tax=Simiduia agarivorans (strain DSM 21679 / JCM 13881 / BCRC 17597 / SA1) TaxID=1117647 RepID=R9S688_SIMAS|nr:hypothetical protein M5M_13471 [Simiduia agarivorans SA1 = DSM 21679]
MKIIIFSIALLISLTSCTANKLNKTDSECVFKPLTQEEYYELKELALLPREVQVCVSQYIDEHREKRCLICSKKSGSDECLGRGYTTYMHVEYNVWIQAYSECQKMKN